MGTENNKLIGSLRVGDGGTKIDVVIGERDGEEIVALQLSTWHETLGWLAQKTIPFEAEKIGQLQRLLSQTRNHIEDRSATVGATAKVIEFAARRSGTQAPKLASQSAAENDDQAASSQ
jgi:hypothetical protein